MKKLIIIFTLICSFLLFNTCDIEHVVFGSRVNTEVPVISTPEEEQGSGPGAFLRGSNNTIFINVEQPFGLESVFMTLWYTDNNGEENKRIITAKTDERGLWFVIVDSTDMADGAIRSQVTAIDISGNATTTTDMIYIVKNIPPQVELTLPKVVNFDDPNMNNETESVIQGSDIIGLATDAFGVAAGYPQILFWPADYANVDEDGIPFPDDLHYGLWRTATDSKRNPLSKDGLKAVQFRWPLVELVENEDGSWTFPSNNEQTVLSSGLYRFKVRVMDKFGIVNTYPNRQDNVYGYDEADKRLNQYIEFNLSAATGPIIQWYDFPQHYNGKTPFKAVLRITSASGIQSVRAGVSNDANKNSIQWVSAVSLGYNLYEITIQPELIPETSPGVKTGNKFFHVEAQDESSMTSASREFILDDIPPTLEFAVPYGFGTNEIPQVTSSVIFRAISDDNTRVVRLYYALGKTETAAVDLSENPMDMRAEEFLPGSGWIDTHLHATPLMNHPGEGNISAKWGGSLYSWNWRFTDIADLCKYPAPAVNSSGNYYVEDYDWAHNLWTLPIYFKIVDAAGNVRIYKEKVIVDPDADKPTVLVSSHTSGQTVGGAVRINGSATDNEMIYAVEVKITMQTDEQCGSDETPSFPVTSGFVPVNIAGNMGSTVSWFYSLNADGSLNPPQGANTRRVLLEFRAADAYLETPNIFKQYGNINQIVLNFDNTIPVIDNIKIIRGLSGDEETSIIEDYNVGSRVSEFITLKAKIRDNGGITSIMLRSQETPGFTDIINSITPNDNESFVIPPVELKPADSVTFGRLYYIKESSAVNNFASLQAGPPAHIPVVDSGGNFIAINEHAVSGGVLLEANVPSDDFIGQTQFFEYTIYIPLNTNANAQSADAILNGRFHNGAGNYEIAVQVSDNTHPVPYIMNETISLQIDNYYPFASYNGHLNAMGNYSISGSAWDTGTGIGVQGVDKIVVYFSRNGNPVSLNEKGGVSASWVNNQKAKQNRKGDTNTLFEEGVLNTLPFFPDVRQSDGTYAATNSGIVINTTGVSGGCQVSFTGNPVKDWSAVYDTSRLNDGPVTVNYVVFDSAGNASHYTQDIYVANNRPVITIFSLGTDITANGSVTSDEYISYSPQTRSEFTTDFRIRENRFALGLQTESGNGQKSYSVMHVTRTGPVSAYNIIKGRVYTIFDAGDINWIDYGVFERPANNFYYGVTFTATSDYLGYGSGTVYTYTHSGNVNTVKTGTLAGNSAQNIIFNQSSFGASPLISDSVTASDAQGNAVLNHSRYFIIKVYDTTVAGAGENEQLSDTILINADVNNNDAITPRISISPFFWNNEGDNSLYRNSKNNGHIEYESDLDPSIYSGSTGIRDKDPKVSGKISIRGRAFDSHVIGSIYFKIDGFTPSGASAGSGDTAGFYLGAQYSSGALTGIGSFDTNGWQFNITGVTHNQSGHTVFWQLDLDTSRVTNIAAIDRVTSVIARDLKPNYSGIDAYRMDIVPYIFSIETNNRTAGGLKADNIRSADGKYSVIQGSDNNFITVRGFNLTPASVRILNETENNNYKNNPSSVPAGTNVSFNAEAANLFTMTNNLNNSGYLTVVVSGIGTLNNINNNNSRGSYAAGTFAIDQEHMPNRRADPYNTGNIMLTDDTYLQFYTVRKTIVRNGYYPVMILEEDESEERVVFGYVDHTGGVSGYSEIGPNLKAGTFHPEEAMPQRAKFRLDDAQMLDTEFLAKMMACEQMAMARDESGRFLHVFNYDRDDSYLNMVYDRYAELHSHASNNSFSRLLANLGTAYARGTLWQNYLLIGGTATNNGVTANEYYAGNNAIPLESTALGGFVTLNRYQYPKLITRGNSITDYAEYCLSYYDAAARQIILRSFRIGKQGEDLGGTGSLFNTRTSNRSLNDLNLRLQYCVDAKNREYEAFHNLYYWNRIEAVSGAGISNHFDMAVDSRGRAVIVYYDESASKLAIRYTSRPTNGFTDVDHPFTDSAANIFMPNFVGNYVSVCIDDNDRLHIAAFDSINGTLKYIFVGNFAALTAANTGVKTVTVDQFGSVGYWTHIKIHPLSKVPHIAYYNAAENGTREPIKLAWAKEYFSNVNSVKGGVDDNNGYTTGDWEYRTIPAIDPPQGGTYRFQRVNLDFRSNGDRDPVLGYLGNNLEFSYPVGE